MNYPEKIFEAERGPFHFDLLNFNDPYGLDMFKKNVDPENKFKNVQIEYQGTNIRRFYLKSLLKNLESSNDTKALYFRLKALYQAFRKTESLKSLGITFEPIEENGALKMILVPHNKSKLDYNIINHGMDGSFDLTGQVRIHNVTGLLDHIALRSSLGYYGKLKNGFGISYYLPVFYKNFSLAFGFGKETNRLNRSTNESRVYQSIKIYRRNLGFSLTYLNRWNTVDLLNYSANSLEQDLEPSTKVEISVEKVWSQIRLKSGWVNVFKLDGSLASDDYGGKQMKVGIINHSIFHPNLLFKFRGKFFQLINDFRLETVVPLFGSRLRINDRIFKTNVPGFSEIVNPEVYYDKSLHPFAGNKGFEFLGDHRGDDVCLRNNFKINFLECPILKQAHIVPFIYYSYAYFSGDVMSKWLKPSATNHTILGDRRRIFTSVLHELQSKSRSSLGVGIKRNINSSVHVEGLVNLFTFGKPSDKAVRFQIRFSLAD